MLLYLVGVTSKMVENANNQIAESTRSNLTAVKSSVLFLFCTFLSLSLRKKLCCVKTSLCKYLLCGSQRRRWPRQYLGAQLWQRKVKLSRRLKRTRTARPNQAELFGVCENGALLRVGPSGQAGPPIACTAADKLSVAGTPKRLLPGSVQEEVSDNTDIDAIFAAMGV